MTSSQRIFFFLLALLFLPVSLEATHNRAGEITYRHISGFTFEVTVTTYTYEPSKANRLSLVISWGDGTATEVARTTKIDLPNNYLFNTYVTQHTFPGAGTYQILMEDPNRNLGVKNIPNSVNTIFSIQTTMLIGPFVGINSTPILLNPPIDNAGLNHIFRHNPAAFDADGDSLSFELTECTEDGGRKIETYEYPPASDSIYIESKNGDLIWATPTETGVYNIAMFIDEWRDGVKIGRITRDMQVDVYETDNNPPVNGNINDFCIESGDTIEFLITSTDIDNDPIKQYMTGAPVLDSSASFDFIEGGAGYSTSRFTWATNCNQARQQPYVIVIKAVDVVNEISLVDITSFNVRILPSAPKNLIADPGTDLINLNWDISNCGNPLGYKIYRRVGSYGFIPDSCENGVPNYTGFELIDQVIGFNNNSYIDDDHGKALVPGFDYCYMVTAIYSDGVESFVSNEVCATLVPGVPAILEVSVLADDAASGEISVKWAVPIDFDTIDDGPYRYEIYRLDPDETDYTLISTINTIDLTDTNYLDQNINTLEFPYFYSVRLLYQDNNGDWILHPGYESASSLYLNLIGRDNNISIEILKRSPWSNYSFDIFRKPESSTDFDLIDTSPDPEYIDVSLANDFAYTYRVRSMGLRPINEVNYETVNISHINTTSAIDSIAPCAPIPNVVSVCDSSYNVLSWISSNTICGDIDVVDYRIYYSPNLNTELQLIENITPPDTTFIHKMDLETLAAVYGVAAVDSFGNTSTINIISIDSCIMYSLPNVFSPNGDGINDTYNSWNMGGFVKKAEMIIFNRYGQVVFETNDPDISWNGYHKDSGQLVSTGVYYYVCDFYEPRLNGEVYRNLKGFIHVFSGDENKQISE